MSKKLKALLCALVAGAMLATSTGVTAFAADETTEKETVVDATGAEVEVTEAPETEGMADLTPEEQDQINEGGTDAEEQTPEPTEEAKEEYDYSADSYYDRALKVCSALGIITGYDDGSIQPNSTVTRAEMATIILRMIAISASSTYQDIFIDVDASHWASSVIETAVEQGIIDGMGDGTFVPDGPVKYEQVMKMIVCAMNYGTDAEAQGGYPSGYLSVAGSPLKLMTKVNGKAGDDMPRGEVIKAVFNALLASYRIIDGFKNGDSNRPEYKVGDTLGVEKFDMYEEEGILTTTSNISIASGVKSVDGMVTVSGVDYKCDLKVDDLVATKVKFYYIKDKADTNRIIAMSSMDKSTEYTFEDEDIASIDTVGGTLKVYPSKSSSSTKSYKITDATIIYNGSVFAYSNGTYDDEIVPEVGTVRIVDYDDDGVYDIIFIEKYEQWIVTTATTEKLTGRVNNATADPITYDLDDSTYEISVTKSGVEASPKNLKKNDVAMVKMNRDGTKISIVVTGENITGTIDSVISNNGDDEMSVIINGEEYDVDKNAWDDISTGISGTFYLDMFNRIGYVDTDSKLASGETYGMIANAFYNDEGDLIIRICSQDGKLVEAKPASSIKVWLPGATSATSSISDDALKDALLDDDSYIQVGSSAYPLKLCKYKLNSNGELSKLYVAVSSSNAGSSSDALVAYTSASKNNSLNGVSSVGGAVDGYYIEDGIVRFVVPKNATDMKDYSNYEVGTVTASRYKAYDGGLSQDYTIADFTNARYPNVLVEYADSSSSVSAVDAIDNASNNPTFMLSKMTKAVDDDGEVIWKLTGYVGGSEITYYTTQNTGIYDLNTGYTGTNSGRKYTSIATLYDATSDDADVLKSNIEAGDVFLVGANGSNIKTLIRLVNAERVTNAFWTGATYTQTDSYAGQWQTQLAPSNTREKLYAGFVSTVDIGDDAFITLFNSVTGDDIATLTYDTGTTFSLVTIHIDDEGNIKNIEIDKDGGITPSEVNEYSAGSGEYDFAFFKSFKGSMSNGYILRIKEDQ